MKSQDPKNFVTIGVISGVKGLQGEVRVHLFSGEASWLKQVKEIFLSDKRAHSSSLVPYKILKAKMEPKCLLIKFENIGSREQAELLKGMEVSIPAELFKTAKGEKIFLREIQGYKVFNGELFIGKITGFETNQAQDIIIVKADEGSQEILIPLVKAFIVKIDHRVQEIRMNLPEGLVEVNRAL